jgi:hypothetical protein
VSGSGGDPYRAAVIDTIVEQVAIQLLFLYTMYHSGMFAYSGSIARVTLCIMLVIGYAAATSVVLALLQCTRCC